ncbi:MAG: CotH kinase family protein, partial [Chthoniobacteraceae bacterium]
MAFPAEDTWNGRSTMAANARFPYSQALGSALYTRAGVPPQETAVVKMRLNGADLAEAGARMYGRYARVEGRGSKWAKNHYPNDPDGNFYRLDYHNPGPVGVPPGNLGSGEFRYEGTDPAAYADTYLKENNLDKYDFSDLMNLIRIVSAPITGGTTGQPAIPDSAYPAAIGAVLDLDETYRFIATDALIGNMEGGLQNGGSDDASLYRGLVDTRFKFVPHDMDTIFDSGDTTGGVTRNIFSYDGGSSPGNGVLGLTRLFNHPQLLPRYYAALLEGLNTWFNNATIDPIIDQIMAVWVPLTDTVSQNRSINDMKAFVAARRTNVLNQIQQNYSLTVSTAVANTPEGYQQTTDGAATFSGTFNVARTYSITVNGQLASLVYRTRTNPAATAGTWNLAAAAGGGVLKPGLNKVSVKFWDAPNGTGNVLTALTADVYYNSGTSTGIAGALTAGSLRLTAPSSYLPGKSFLARVDLLDGQGNVDRTAWDTTVTLTSNAAGVTLPPAQLYNGTGSVLITAGGSGGGGTAVLIQAGGTLQAPNASAPDWRILDAGAEPTATWKSDLAFDDSTWTVGKLQAGAGDADERTILNNVPGSATNTRRAFYFRKSFTVTDPSTFTTLLLKAVVDDGAVFYLNGTEVYRDGMPSGALTLTTPASANRSGTAESQTNTFDISAFKNLLQAGTNLLAVEVHNYSLGTTYSADLSFDCELDGVAPSTDPGNFIMTAAGRGFAAQRALTSLGTNPAVTAVSGTLATGTTTWSGIVQVTADVTVPAGGTLNIAPGTHVLVDGDATAGSNAGKRIIVNGALNSQGTAANPVAITATNATDRWGGFLFSAAQPSTLSYTLVNHAGHTTGVGHTSRGPTLRLTGSSVALTDSVLADAPGKAIYTSGACSLTIQRSLIERMITGPEVEDGCTVLCEDTNIQRILPDYRESNAPLSDDEDCFYVHNSSGRSIVMNRCVFAR